MTIEEHKAKHVLLHNSLDELAADYIICTGKLPSQTTILDLIRWSHQQTLAPIDAATRKPQV